MTEFKITKCDNYLLINNNGKIMLLDTGAPFTVSRTGKLNFLGENVTTTKNFFGVTAEGLSINVGTHIDVLLGADILSKYSILIRAKSDTIAFTKKVLDIGGATFPFENLAGVPIINFNFHNRSCKGFLDTGAPISYVKPEMTAGYDSLGEHPDFFPLYGEFTTPTYQIPVTISGKPFNAIFGKLPDDLHLIPQGLDGIIGYDFFNSFDVLMNYPEKMITIKEAA